MQDTGAAAHALNSDIANSAGVCRCLSPGTCLLLWNMVGGAHDAGVNMLHHHWQAAPPDLMMLHHHRHCMQQRILLMIMQHPYCPQPNPTPTQTKACTPGLIYTYLQSRFQRCRVAGRCPSVERRSTAQHQQHAAEPGCPAGQSTHTYTHMGQWSGTLGALHAGHACISLWSHIKHMQ